MKKLYSRRWLQLGAVILALLLVLVVSAGGAQAQGPNVRGGSGARPPVTVGGGWQFFTSLGCGTINVDGAFTFSTSGPFILKVTDFLVDGDRWSVYNFGTLIGITSVPADDGGFLSSPDAAFADPRFSHGAIAGGPGDYSLTFKLSQCATGVSAASGAFRVDPASPSDVPEGDTLLLMSGGLGGLATWLGWQFRKVRRKKQV